MSTWGHYTFFFCLILFTSAVEHSEQDPFLILTWFWLALLVVILSLPGPASAPWCNLPCGFKRIIYFLSYCNEVCVTSHESGYILFLCKVFAWVGMCLGGCCFMCWCSVCVCNMSNMAFRWRKEMSCSRARCSLVLPESFSVRQSWYLQVCEELFFFFLMTLQMYALEKQQQKSMQGCCS